MLYQVQVCIHTITSIKWTQRSWFNQSRKYKYKYVIKVIAICWTLQIEHYKLILLFHICATKEIIFVTVDWNPY